MADAKLYCCPDCTTVIAVEHLFEPDDECPACDWSPVGPNQREWRFIGEVSR